MMPSITYSTNRSLPETFRGNRMGDPSAAQDQRIRQAQNGDLEAFNELVLIYQDSVFRQALWVLNEEEAAEDATQEVFLMVYRKIQSFHGGPFRPWLLRITTNYCIDQIRAAKRRPCQPLNFVNEFGEETEAYWIKDPSDSPEKVIERTETGDEILRCIRRLPTDYRMVVILIDLEDLDYQQAAAVLNLPLGTFKSRLSRARKMLRDDLLRGTDHSYFGEALDRKII